MIIPGWEIVQNFIRRQIGVRTDTASSTGSVMARLSDLKNTLAQGFVVAGTTQRAISSAEKSLTSYNTYTKAKEILLVNSGINRISFSIKGPGLFVRGRIYKNGVAYGTEFINSTTLDAYITYSEDLNFAAGDLMQLYLYGNNTGLLYCKDLKVSFEYANTPQVLLN